MNKSILLTRSNGISLYKDRLRYVIKPKTTVKALLQDLNEGDKKSRIVNIKCIQENDLINAKIEKLYFDLSLLSESFEVIPIQQNLSYLITSDTKLEIKYFDIIRQIGQGTYSQVYLVERKYDRKQFAMKKINKSNCKSLGQIDYIINEVEVLKKLRNKSGIIELYFVFEDSVNVYLIQQYCPSGDLFNCIKVHKRLNEDQARVYFIQIVLALDELHKIRYIYRDLKPENILIDFEGYLKLSDFGFAKQCVNKLFDFCGSYEYMPPELLNKQGYDFCYDIYTLGILLYEMIQGKTPFRGFAKLEYKQAISKPIQFTQNFSELSQDLILKLVDKNAGQRLGSNKLLQILRHDWLKPAQQTIKKILDRRLQPKYILQPKQKSKEIFKNRFPSAHSETLNLHYNYLVPDFEVSLYKFGPKLQTVAREQ